MNLDYKYFAADRSKLPMLHLGHDAPEKINENEREASPGCHPFVSSQ
jgi:hypothetical protein